MRGADTGKIGLWPATLLATGSIVGSGVYLLPVSLAPYGAKGLLGWGGAILLSVLLGYVFSRLAILSDGRQGGFIDRIAEAFGPFAAYLAAALYWAQAALGNIALALAVTGAVLVVVPALDQGGKSVTVLCLAILWLLTGIALRGPRVIAALEGWTLVLGLAPVVGLGLFGWFWFDPALFGASWSESAGPLLVTLPQTILLALWAFLGLETASLATDMVDDPQRVVPRATMAGIVLAALVYVPACAVLYGIVRPSVLIRSTAPFADVAARLLGSGAGVVVAASAAFKAAGTLAGWILLTAEAGRKSLHLLRGTAPADNALSGRHILANSVLQSFVILTVSNPSLAGQFTDVINGAVIVMLSVYAIAAAALIRLQYRITGWRHPAIGGGAIAIMAMIVVGALQDASTLLVLAVLLVVAGLGWAAWHSARQRAEPRGG